MTDTYSRTQHNQAQPLSASVPIVPTGQVQKPTCILRLPEVMARVGIRRALIYQRIADGTFPKQISLGARAVGWLESDIDAWLAARIMAAKGGAALLTSP